MTNTEAFECLRRFKDKYDSAIFVHQQAMERLAEAQKAEVVAKAAVETTSDNLGNAIEELEKLVEALDEQDEEEDQ